MHTDDINQALRLSIQELSQKLADELVAKNLLALQVTTLQGKVSELETLLDTQTKQRGGNN